MTAAAFAGIVLAGGTRQIAASAPMATLAAVGWLLAAGLVIILSAVAVRFLRRWHLPREPFPKEQLCPCCSGLDSDDCTCREDCGVTQCQAADPDEHEGTQPMEELDVPDFIREAREQDRAEAADDYLGGLLAEWERDWRKQRGGNGA